MFYAGHGIEMDGVNYLVPVDARLGRDLDVRYETVTVDDLLVSTTGALLRLVILDACRNNPLARSMQRTAATRTVSGGSFADLNDDLLEDETLVAYAAAAGTTAADGRDRNSPYTAALLSHLETPLEVGLLFRRVRAQVLAATNGAQRPHEYHSLVGEHYLTRTLATGASLTVSAAVPANPAPADPPRPDPPEIDVTEVHIVALRELAEAGVAEAQHEMAERHANGRGVGRDFGVAMSWYVRAAEQGHVPAQLEVGRRYAAGQGVQRNEEVAASWFRRAAEQGNPRAQFDLVQRAPRPPVPETPPAGQVALLVMPFPATATPCGPTEKSHTRPISSVVLTIGTRPTDSSGRKTGTPRLLSVSEWCEISISTKRRLPGE